jgi:hypothetical protein
MHSCAGMRASMQASDIDRDKHAHKQEQICKAQDTESGEANEKCKKGHASREQQERS